MLKDKTSAGNKVNMRFLVDYMTYVPEIEPEQFDICHIILTQPECDRWTPQFLSELFLSKIEKVPVTKVVLKKAVIVRLKRMHWMICTEVFRSSLPEYYIEMKT